MVFLILLPLLPFALGEHSQDGETFHDTSLNSSNCDNSNVPALIMTGGWNGDDLRSVLVYHPGTNTTCTLPRLDPPGISAHSQDGLVACGGKFPSSRSCCTLNTDTAQWTTTHRLSEPRWGHTSWKREDGSNLLIGGAFSETTTELVSDSSGVSTPGFTLKYETG